jgi:outer membrane protein assembly factor BamC
LKTFLNLSAPFEKSFAPVNFSLLGFLLLCLALISGCESTSFNGNKVDYKSSADVKTTPLDVPPDLSQLPSSARYSIPGGVSAKNLSGTSTSGSPKVAPSNVGDVSIARDGSQRWLVVNRACDQVWPLVHAFWPENGFVYTTDQKDLGVLETDWAENKANFPKDFLHHYLGKVIDMVSSTGLRDRYRTRLEATSENTCEIYIAQRGISEEYADAARITTTWKPRPNDPELENEFLRRLMVKLGTTAEFANKSLAGISVASSAKLTLVNGKPVVELSQSFDNSWRRLGVALDRGGFTVEDRDRKAGLYFVRYVDKPKDTSDVPWYKSIFSSSKPTISGPQKYRLKLVYEDDVTKIMILNNAGDPDGGEIAKKIANILVGELK